jgi:amidase
MSKPTNVHADLDGYAELDAVETARRFNSGEIAASSAVVAALARAKRLGQDLGCLATLNRDHAIELASSIGRGGVFAGVPTLIKDTDNWIGLPTRMGSRALPNVPATTQTPYMDAIAASGIVPIGKSAVPEFAMHVTTEPVGFGSCVNPWNKAHSAGGSSGGAAVAVATRIVPIAHAGDAAGSIRIPAACCGVLGFKPSRGRTITNGDDGGPAQVTSQGAIARSVRDLAAWMRVTQAKGIDALYPEIGPHDPLGKRLRIGVQLQGISGQYPCSETTGAVLATAQALEARGHIVCQNPIAPLLGDNFRDAFALYWGFATVSIVGTLTEQLGRPLTDTDLEARTLKIATDFMPRMGDLPNAMGILTSAWDRTSSIYDSINVILSPVTSRPAPVLGSLDIDACGMDMVVHVLDYASYTPIQNATGQPAISIPAGFSHDGLPIGVQLTAKPGDDDLILTLVRELERESMFKIGNPMQT